MINIINVLSMVVSTERLMKHTKEVGRQASKAEMREKYHSVHSHVHICSHLCTYEA